MKQFDESSSKNSSYFRWDLPICHHISQKIVSRCKTILLSYEDSSQAEITGAVILLSTLKPEVTVLIGSEDPEDMLRYIITPTASISKQNTR